MPHPSTALDDVDNAPRTRYDGGAWEPRWIEAFGNHGHPYSYIEWPAVQIPDDYLDTAVFLYPSKAEAVRGNTESGGTGFLISVPLADDLSERAFYVVTNKHCARHEPTVRLNTQDGETEVLTRPLTAWTCSDTDDLAVLPIGLRRDYFRFHAVTVERNHAGVIDERSTVRPGTDAFFVGRYVTLSGVQRNTPVVRFGAVSMAPPEPIPHSENASGTQDGFLVEARSRSGFSGSPVFVYSVMAGAMGATIQASIGNIALLGIVWGHLPHWESVREAPSDGAPARPAHYVHENSNMACVVPAWKLLDLLDDKKLADARADQAAEVRGTPTATLDFADESGEFERFEGLTDRLLRVPKKELDEKLKGESS